MRDTDVVQHETVAEAGAHGLGGGFLGGETLGEKMRLARFLPELGKLGRRENAFREFLAVALDVLLHARHAHDVRANAEDHRARASRISRFISRTASCNPLNSARATIAWPILSSAMPGMAASACTL